MDYVENKLFHTVDVVEKNINESKKEVTTIITTNAVDRTQDIVEPDGANLTNFKKNPVMLFNHNYDAPIGKWSRTKKVDLQKGLRGIQSTATFANTSKAAELFELVKDGVLSSFSIGFIPTDYEKIESKDENHWPGYHIKKWELLETSLVSVPANPTANINQKFIQDFKERLSPDLYKELNPHYMYDQILEDLTKRLEDLEGDFDNLDLTDLAKFRLNAQRPEDLEEFAQIKNLIGK